MSKSKQNNSSKEEKVKSSNKKSFQTLRGMNDILPDDSRYFLWIFDQVREIAQSYSLQLIETPILEPTDLFVRGIGKQTDIVEKEMFSFVDQGGDKVTVRPEATASVARAYIEHGMLSWPQPVKLWYWGKMLRRERPQAGRLREFHQFGFEILGSDDPMIDAQIIFLTFKVLQGLGLEVNIPINSIGCDECRVHYRKVLIDYYRPKRSELCDDCKKRLNKNPFRLLDCKEKGCQTVAASAPQTVDYLCDQCRDHFMKVVDYLDELDVPCILKPTLVRGLDYYNRTVFEVWTSEEEESRQAALGGGGRYDGLIEMLGGRPTPAAGVAVGIERVVKLLKEKDITPPNLYQPEVFVAQLGEEAKRKSLLLFEELRTNGIKAAESLSKDGLKAQLEIANKLGVKYTLILGQKEILDNTVMLRDMESGNQEVIDLQKIVSTLRKRLHPQEVDSNIKKNKLII